MQDRTSWIPQIGKDDPKALAIGINDFFHLAVVDWGLIMAAGGMVTIAALVFFVTVQRYLTAGWGAGGVKGQHPHAAALRGPDEAADHAERPLRRHRAPAGAGPAAARRGV